MLKNNLFLYLNHLFIVLCYVAFGWSRDSSIKQSIYIFDYHWSVEAVFDVVLLVEFCLYLRLVYCWYLLIGWSVSAWLISTSRISSTWLDWIINVECRSYLTKLPVIFEDFSVFVFERALLCCFYSNFCISGCNWK